MARAVTKTVVSKSIVDCLEHLFAVRVRSMHASEIRELLSLTQQPDIISFAGGLPNPDTFPIDEIRKICDDVLRLNGRMALQYSTTEGLPQLREEIAKWVNRLGINATIDNTIVVQGSQQAIDLTSKMFLNAGDSVIVGSPTYVGGSNSFDAYEAVMHQVLVDNDGMNTDLLEEKIKELHRRDIHPKFAYVIPTFQNPSGVLMPENRRKKLIELAHEYDFLIVEDSPYGEIQFEGEPIRPIKSYDDEGRVIYLGTFSKILSPGMRIAFVIAHEAMIKKFIIAKQAMDLCSNTFAQFIGIEALKRGILIPHIKKIREMYKHKWLLMQEGLEKHMPKEHVKWNVPKGGMFTWVTVPKYIDTAELLKVAINKYKIAYVIGAAFYPDRSVKNCMRVSFSYPSDEAIKIGVERLATVIKGAIKD